MAIYFNTMKHIMTAFGVADEMPVLQNTIPHSSNMAKAFGISGYRGNWKT